MNITDERLKIWLSFWKWFLSAFIITGGIAITTAIVNKKEKETQLQISINEQEKEYLTSFLENALDVNVETRLRFAQYFASVANSEQYRNGWKEYLQIVTEEYKTTQEAAKKLEQTLPEKTGEQRLRAQEELERLRAQLTPKRSVFVGEPLSYLTAPLDALIKSASSCPNETDAIVWMEKIMRFPGVKDGYYIAQGCQDKNGQRTGLWVAYYESGKVVQQGQYINGRLDGITMTWFESGSKAGRIKRRNGLQIGFVYWNESGRVVQSWGEYDE
jgi:antitoxin component YwqK of YwqJK toxin-antitoxin module